MARQECSFQREKMHACRYGTCALATVGVECLAVVMIGFSGHTFPSIGRLNELSLEQRRHCTTCKSFGERGCFEKGKKAAT